MPKPINSKSSMVLKRRMSAVMLGKDKVPDDVHLSIIVPNATFINRRQEFLKPFKFPIKQQSAVDIDVLGYFRIVIFLSIPCLKELTTYSYNLTFR